LVKKNKKTLIDRQPIGTGPFQFKKYIKDSVIRYDAFKDYFEGEAKIKKLVFSITPDASVRFQKLKTGECDFIAEPSPIDLPMMRSNKNIKIVEKPGLNVGYLAMNVEKPPLDNVLVRRAIHHALNRKLYIKAIYKGSAQVAKSALPPSMWSYDKSLKDYEYNIKKSKALLKKAGFEKGIRLKLWTLPVSRPHNPKGKKMGELMQADLAKVGIHVDLVTYKWATYLDKASKGQHELIQMGWTGDNGDPDNFLNVLLGCAGIKAGSNFSRWCNKNFDHLISQAKRITGNKQRTQFYKKAQQLFKKEAPWVTLVHAKTFRAMRSNVTG